MKSIIFTVLCLLLVIACDDELAPPGENEHDRTQTLEAFSVDTIITLEAGGLSFEPDEGMPVLYAQDGSGPDLKIRNLGTEYAPRVPAGFDMIPSSCHSPNAEGCSFGEYGLIPASGQYFGTELRNEEISTFGFYVEDRDSFLLGIDSSFHANETVRMPLCCETDPNNCVNCRYQNDNIYHFRGGSSNLFYSITSIEMELVSDSANVVYWAHEGYVEAITRDVELHVRIEGYRQNNPNSTWVMP